MLVRAQPGPCWRSLPALCGIQQAVNTLHPWRHLHHLTALGGLAGNAVPSHSLGVQCWWLVIFCLISDLPCATEGEWGWDSPLLSPPFSAQQKGSSCSFLGVAQWAWEVWTGIKETGKFFGPSCFLLGTMSPIACPLSCKFEGISESRWDETSPLLP